MAKVEEALLKDVKHIQDPGRLRDIILLTGFAATGNISKMHELFNKYSKPMLEGKAGPEDAATARCMSLLLSLSLGRALKTLKEKRGKK